MARLKSMDVTIRGVTKTYEFDPATPVDSDDEGEASLELVNEAETTEVVLAASTVASARIRVSYTVRYDGEVEVELEDLEVDDIDDLVYQVEMGNFQQVVDEVDEDAQENLSDYLTIDEVTVEAAFDEDGESIEE